jgi:hypothetical protein
MNNRQTIRINKREGGIYGEGKSRKREKPFWIP